MIEQIARDLLNMGLCETPAEAKKYAYKVLDILYIAEARQLTPSQVRRMMNKLFSRKDKGEYGYGGDWWKKGKRPDE